MVTARLNLPPRSGATKYALSHQLRMHVQQQSWQRTSIDHIMCRGYKSGLIEPPTRSWAPRRNKHNAQSPVQLSSTVVHMQHFLPARGCARANRDLTMKQIFETYSMLCLILLTCSLSLAHTLADVRFSKYKKIRN